MFGILLITLVAICFIIFAIRVAPYLILGIILFYFMLLIVRLWWLFLIIGVIIAVIFWVLNQYV